MNRGSYPINSYLTINDILSKKQILKSIIQRKSKICLAADFTTIDDIIRLVKTIGKYICILKLHVDIIEDWTPESPKILNNLKKKYDFMIWEDRKFADIGHIVKSQLHGGMYKISSWADIISVHLVSGPDILDACKPCMIFGISHMSSRGTLTNKDYEAMALTYCYRNAEGVVTQSDNSSSLLNVVPGIKLVEGKDDMGQQYNTIKNKSFADIFVIGRGITMAENPEKEIIKYIEQINL